MAYLWCYHAQEKTDFIMETATYFRLGTGNSVLYLFAENYHCWEAAEVLLPCAFYGWILTVGRSSSSTKLSLQAPAVML